MKTKHIILITCIITLGCISKTKERAAGIAYDEAALKEFVLTTVDTNKSNALHVLDSLLTKAAADSTAFFQTVSYLEKPFGDPNSSYRNEDLYAALLQAKMKSQWTDSITKSKTRERLYLLMQNRPGSMANDFVYTTPSGAKKKMYDLKAKFTILFFYNPECPACKEVIEELGNSELIIRNMKSGKLKVLAIYTDKDELIWLDHLPEMPETWIHGRDENEYLYKNKIYDLKAIPTVYLLDKEKKVVLKDCVDVREIEKKLSNQR